MNPFDHVVADFCVIPIGTETPSVSKEIALCQSILKQSKLNYKMHSYGTNVEGPWDSVTDVIKQCHKALHDAGLQRISTTIKIGTRTDKVGTMDAKVKSVEKILSEQN